MRRISLCFLCVASVPAEVRADLPVQADALGKRRRSVAHDAQRSATPEPHVSMSLVGGLGRFKIRDREWFVSQTVGSEGDAYLIKVDADVYLIKDRKWCKL